MSLMPMVSDRDASAIRNRARTQALRTSSGTGYWSTNTAASDGTVNLDNAGGRHGGAAARFRQVTGVAMAAQQWDGTLVPMIPVVSGQPFAFACWVRSVAGVTVAARVRWRTEALTEPVGSSNGTPVVLTAGVWSLVVVTGTVPAGVTRAHVGVQINASTAGNDVWVDLPWYGDTSTIPDVLPHGDLPGWRWLGTVNGSESVGPDYTLRSAAGGDPFRTVLGAATGAIANDPAVAALSPMLGRTLYLVDDVTAGIAAVSVRNSASTSRLTLQNNGPGAVASVATSGGTWSSPAMTVPSGVHVYMGMVTEGLTHIQAARDGVEVAAQSIATPGTGIAWDFTATSGVGHLATYAFIGAHPLETRTRVAAWLARRYGAPIPAGY